MAHRDTWAAVTGIADPVDAVGKAFDFLLWLLDGTDRRLADPAAVVLGRIVIGWMQALAVQGGAVTEEEIMARVRDQLGAQRDAAMFSAITAAMGTCGAPLASAADTEGISVGTAERISADSPAGIAGHESGHAVTLWALGLPFDYVRLDGPDRGSHVGNLPGQTATLSHAMLVGACGYIADYQRRGLAIDDRNVLRLLVGSDDGTFELMDWTTALVAQRVSRAPAVAPGADLELMAEYMAAIAGGLLAASGDDRQPADVIIGMWRQAELFAAQCRPAIDALAARLLERGRLTYAEACSIADAAMAGLPMPAVPGEQ